MVLKVFLLSHFCLVFLPTTLASLPSGVMLLKRSTTLRDSANDIEKTSQKEAPEQERPNRSTVKSTSFYQETKTERSLTNVISFNPAEKFLL